MVLSLAPNHSALALFAQRTRIPTSARSIGFCAIWVCISSSLVRMFRWSKLVQFSVWPFDFPDFVGRALL
jgi:FtsH-binding integral membrane protein